jgi:O-antigen ligase
VTTAILAAGLVLVVAIAIVLTQPRWRVPAVVFGLLAIPGNVDDLLPQMTLDPHVLNDVSAPVVSSADLLLLLAVVLTIREGRRTDVIGRRLTILALVLMALAWATSLYAAASGVEFAAVVRGMILFARIPALFYLATSLRTELSDGSRVAMAVVAGGVSVLGNGLYTTITGDLDRFTARTFGRNGLAILLVFIIVVATGLVYARWAAAGKPGWGRLIAPVSAIIAAGSLFGASASGTRMGFLVLLFVGAIGAVINPVGLTRQAVKGMVLTFVAATVILGASVVLTTAGGRTVSVITDPDTTVDVVTNPGSVPTETEIRSRGQFWELALQMARANPLTGVGPFQWNVRRYDLDPNGPVAVADAHNSYLQVAAEYGLVVLAVYLALLLLSLGYVGWRLRHSAVRESLGWTGLGLSVACLVFPLADATNSHLFNIRNGAVEWLAIAVAVALASAAGATLKDTDPAP